MNIHISNLSRNIIDADLLQLFSKFGAVNTAVVVRDKASGRSEGTAFVDMINDADASEAIQQLDHKVIDGQPISVSELRFSLAKNKN